MNDNLVAFDPRVFALLNPHEGERTRNKTELYQYYYQRRSYLYSNLTLQPKYQKKIGKILRLDYYRENIYPVRNEREMYYDIIARLQYTPLLDFIVDYQQRAEVVKLFFGQSSVNKVNESNYVLVKASPELFFQYLSLSRFNISYWHGLRTLYEDEYLEDAVATIVEQINKKIEALVAMRRHLTLIQLDRELPILVIKCYDPAYMSLIYYFHDYLASQYQILIEHVFFLDWDLQKITSYDNILIRNLTLFYHLIPDKILYLGDLNSLKETIVHDRSAYPNANQYYYYDNCFNLPIYLVPLLRSFKRVYLHSEQSLALARTSRIFHQTEVELQVVTFSENKLPASHSFLLPDEEIPKLDKKFIWIYAIGNPPNNDNFIEWCQTLDLPIRFVLPKTEFRFKSSLNVTYLPINIILHPNFWKQCQVYLDFGCCLRYQTYFAILNRQLLLLPKTHCGYGDVHFDRNEILTGNSPLFDCFSFPNSILVTPSLNLKEVNYQMKYDVNPLEQIVNLITTKNLDNSKRRQSIYIRNSRVLRDKKEGKE